MALLRRRSVFAAKVETTVGTAETLTATEAVFNARDFMIQPEIPMTRREGQGGFNYLESVPEGMMGTCQVTHEITYDGTTTPNWASVLLPACGWVDTANVFSPVSRGPGNGGVKTITIGHYHDGKLKRLSGAMGNFVITCPTGKAAFITFTFTGKYFEDETDATLLAPTYPTAAVLRFADGSISFNSVDQCTATVAIDAGNTVVMREKAEASNRTGYISAVVTDRAPIITADPEAVLAATQNLDTLWVNSTTAAWALTLNATGTATVVIDAPAAQIENSQQGDRNGIISKDITWLATEDTTPDGELTITFTPNP